MDEYNFDDIEQGNISIIDTSLEEGMKEICMECNHVQVPRDQNKKQLWSIFNIICSECGSKCSLKYPV